MGEVLRELNRENNFKKRLQELSKLSPEEKKNLQRNQEQRENKRSYLTDMLEEERMNDNKANIARARKLQKVLEEFDSIPEEERISDYYEEIALIKEEIRSMGKIDYEEHIEDDKYIEDDDERY